MSRPEAERRAVRVRIRGYVQGVWFRSWVRQEADKRNLAGWVRNRSDGTVEALFVGPAAAVEALVAACWQGPPHARVELVEVENADDEAANIKVFSQRATL